MGSESRHRSFEATEISGLEPHLDTVQFRQGACLMRREAQATRATSSSRARYVSRLNGQTSTAIVSCRSWGLAQSAVNSAW